MAITWNNRLDYELQKLIDAEIAIMKDNIAEGSIKSHDEYKYQAGKIAGMRRAIDLLEEAAAICDGKARE
jgi:hypothetical protein